MPSRGFEMRVCIRNTDACTATGPTVERKKREMIKATAVFENAMEASVSERESYSRGQEQNTRRMEQVWKRGVPFQHEDPWRPPNENGTQVAATGASRAAQRSMKDGRGKPARGRPAPRTPRLTRESTGAAELKPSEMSKEHEQCRDRVTR